MTAFIQRNTDMVQSIKDAEYEVYLHGCNCFHTMGAGVAKQLADTFPEVRQADLRTFAGDYSKMGSYSKAILPNGVIVLNLYTQLEYGRTRPHFSQKAAKEAFASVALAYRSCAIAYPLIGGGLAGGNWDEDIYPMIQHEFRRLDHTLILLGEHT